jgi:hypothetical protein
MFISYLFILFGVIFLLDNFGAIPNLSLYWPLLLILIGFAMLRKGGRMCDCGICADCMSRRKGETHGQ